MNRVVFLLFLMSSVEVKAAVADKFITEGLVAILYSDAIFHCNVSGMPHVRWDFKSNFKDIDTVFVKNKVLTEYVSRFNVTVEEEGSVSGFYIRNVTTQEAGVYNCMNAIGAVKIQATYVTVLHSEPSCYLNVQDDTLTAEEGDTVDVVCDVCYTGEATVDVECLSDREADYPSLPVKTTYPHNASCRSYHKTYVTHRHVSESNFTCQVRFYSPTDRVEIYNYTWTSPTLATNCTSEVVRSCGFPHAAGCGDSVNGTKTSDACDGATNPPGGVASVSTPSRLLFVVVSLVAVIRLIVGHNIG